MGKKKNVDQFGVTNPCLQGGDTLVVSLLRGLGAFALDTQELALCCGELCGVGLGADMFAFLLRGDFLHPEGLSGALCGVVFLGGTFLPVKLHRDPHSSQVFFRSSSLRATCDLRSGCVSVSSSLADVQRPMTMST